MACQTVFRSQLRPDCTFTSTFNLSPMAASTSRERVSWKHSFSLAGADTSPCGSGTAKLPLQPATICSAVPSPQWRTPAKCITRQPSLPNLPPSIEGWNFPISRISVFSGCAELPMPESHVNDPVRWRNNAKEMRVLAEGAKDAATRRIMNRLADGWDKLACRAERRARNGYQTSPSHQGC